ncbi:hypothetical protein COJ38_21895 [Bacillus cereus]|nr:hypothetical protein COM91_12490 [Bacillus thuringiensis]PEQ97741.1 hypothetical protein CN477_27940 [Bacillus cereus]PFC05206.1 hypothetical protein CN280_16770 [Bacillus cereus]PFD35000.1 hypothetical protein CN278_17495 [Bacillus thuringiensis]PFK19342.1 hypothetical protein COJ03_23550 [Bacillus cereus]
MMKRRKLKMSSIENVIGSIEQYDYLFCKVLTKNDDSGRHGVLIPVYAYSMFPDFTAFNPIAKVNYTEEIVTIWPSLNNLRKKSSWKHYHRYPERRMTSLSPELLNDKVPNSIFVVCKLKNLREYKCFVITPDSENYMLVSQAFNINIDNDLYEGKAAFISANEFLESEENVALKELIEFIESKKEDGYVKTLKKGDTGVGFTFESMLGISANASKSPDYKGIELKCSRSKQEKHKRKSSTGKQTLFTLIPNWGHLGNRKALVEQHGYDDIERNRKGLYCTIKVVPNSYEFYLLLNREQEKISIMKHGEEVVFYEFERLKEALENKHKESLFITAHARKDEEGEEEFLYDSAIYCNNVSFDGFLDLISENLLGLDFAIHIKDGKARDHGFLWRLENKKYLLRLFETIQEVI